MIGRNFRPNSSSMIYRLKRKSDARFFARCCSLAQQSCDSGREIEASARKIVAGAVNGDQARAGGNKTDCVLHFGDRSEGVGCPMNEDGRRLQIGEMLRAQFLGLLWRVERIRQQQETSDQS